jgi:thioredoxin reductase (NADPH)
VSAVRVGGPLPHRDARGRDGDLLLRPHHHHRRLLPQARRPGDGRLTGRGVYYGAAQTEAFSARARTCTSSGGRTRPGQAAMFFSTRPERSSCSTGATTCEEHVDYLVRQIEEKDEHRGPLNTNVAAVEGEDTWRGSRAQHRDRRDGYRPQPTRCSSLSGGPKTGWLDGLVARTSAALSCRGRT